MKARTAISALLLLLSSSAFASDTPGVTATEITVGSIFPFSGPASALGRIGEGLMAYVQSINDRGGIGGRKIKFIALDDSYTPSKAAEQARKLVESDNIAFTFSM